MEEQTKQISWDFWLLWIIATSAGLVLFSMIGYILLIGRLVGWFLLFVLFVGVFISFPQAFVLKRYVNWAKRWAIGNTYIYPYTIIRIIAIQFLISIISNFLVNDDSQWNPNLFMTLLFGAIFGVLLANDQKKHLEDHFFLSKWWTIANTLAWSGGLIISPLLVNFSITIYSRFDPSFNSFNPILLIISLAGVTGLVIGMISGFSMMYELNQNNKIAKPGSKIIAPESP